MYCTDVQGKLIYTQRGKNTTYYICSCMLLVGWWINLSGARKSLQQTYFYWLLRHLWLAVEEILWLKSILAGFFFNFTRKYLDNICNVRLRPKKHWRGFHGVDLWGFEYLRFTRCCIYNLNMYCTVSLTRQARYIWQAHISLYCTYECEINVRSHVKYFRNYCGLDF